MVKEISNSIKFNKGKSWVMNLERSNGASTDGKIVVGEQLGRKSSGDPGDRRLSLSQ